MAMVAPALCCSLFLNPPHGCIIELYEFLLVYRQQSEVKSASGARAQSRQHLLNAVPLVLLGVCRAWRDIALGTPVLWSTLEIRFNCFPDSVAEEPGLIEGFIDLWLGRSGGCPLSIYLSVMHIPAPADDDDSEEWTDGPFTSERIRDVIQRYSRRMRHVELHMSERDISELGLDSAAFPLLQTAAVWLCFGNYFFHSHQSRWSQLTKFEGLVLDPDLFSLAQKLIEVVCYFPDPDDPWDGPMITHSRLRSLTLSSGDRPETLLHYLTLPALRSLTMKVSESRNYTITLSIFESFLIRSTPPLVSLSTCGVHAPDPMFNCLSYVGETLENLELKSLDEAMVSSILRLNTTTFLPNLRALSLLDVYGKTDPESIVQALYHAQNCGVFPAVWPRGPLFDKVIRAGFGWDTVTGHLARIASDGMQIYVGTSDKNYAVLDGH
ncbi:hypothetical protein B0H17DRAFT_1152541 [Mycena rosella]|uniref:F-box domain-containing protein n=1 Tax=Mycena rosella TaxID=1033263 RepID=A0AAD7BCS2_MYCRO|nr:hypothetical protein B0H17DRAFT_1152541 [Mycena rosella]